LSRSEVSAVSDRRASGIPTDIAPDSRQHGTLTVEGFSMHKPVATSTPRKKPAKPFIPPATADDPNPPEKSANASLPGEGTGTPLLHRLPPSSGAAGAKKG
jgi:hypothetical protein